MSDYKKTLTVDKPIHEVYSAITEHIPDWWSHDLTGAAVHAGDHYTIAFGNTRKTMHIAEAAPDERVVWECVKAHIDMASLKNKSEWVGTKMIWTFRAGDTGTSIDFLHQGLNQDLECYSVCEGGWNTYLASLEAYLRTGKGRPYSK